ncbi:MAG: hypothetical protein NPINA01_19670 [Nitrospinaceae bacterium]|nr:MAG: hypothetical protein NPINA01_19670 [Nitrospinaceae bacterium]
MEFMQDKILGCWFGMAVGDAMGMAVKGLKPETVKQCFGTMDDFKDVRKFIGKGVKQYRMKGLYGVQTQMALAVCDSLLKNKKADVSGISSVFLELAANETEGYFGVFRHAENFFRKAVASLPGREPLLPAEQNHAGCHYPSLAIPIALFNQKVSEEMVRQCMDTCLLMSRNPMEVIGSVLTGHWVTCFLSVKMDGRDEGLSEKEALQILDQGIEICGQAESVLKERYPETGKEFGDEIFQALRLTLQGLREKLHLEEGPLFDWICKNASGVFKNPITHPAQGYVLTLIPLALLTVLKSENDFISILVRALNMGKEAPLLGTLVGAWAGALFGFEKIPQHLKSGLVNSREIKARGEALFMRRPSKSLKNLLEMELALTNKERDERKRHLPKRTHKPLRKVSPAADFQDDDLDEPEMPRKEDAAKWRKFQKDKTRMKRDRRRNLEPGQDS